MTKKQAYSVRILRAYQFEDTIEVDAENEEQAQELAMNQFDISNLQEFQLEDLCATEVKVISDPQIAVDNANRATRAGLALEAYAREIYGSEWQIEIKVDSGLQALGDLLCDLKHLSDMHGIDFDRAVKRAHDHYRCELKGE